MKEFEVIAEKAFKKKGIEDLYNLPEKYAYLKLEELYKMYYSDNISKEKCIVEKQKIKMEYESNAEYYLKIQKVYKEYQDKINQNEYLVCQIGKSQDKDFIIDSLLTIVSNCIMDESFKTRIKEKLE